MNSKKETSYAAQFALEWEQIRAAAALKQNHSTENGCVRTAKQRKTRVSSSAMLF